MKNVSMILIVALLALGAGSALAGELVVGLPKTAAPSIQETLDGMLYEYTVFELDTVAIERQVRETGEMKLHLGNQTFDLVVELNNLRSEDYREVILSLDGPAIELEPSPVTTFAGHLADDPTSIVRLNVLPDRFEGYIKTADEWVFIDPVSDYAREAGLPTKAIASGEVVFYRNGDVIPGEAGLCGSERLQHEAAGLVGQRWMDPAAPVLGAEPRTKAANTLQVAAECDGQYYVAYGSGAYNRMSAVLNAVDGIYESEINTDVVQVFGGCWQSVSGDPYTSLDATTTLYQMRDWWNANQGGLNRDVTHQFSGKDFSGSTIGIAWVGVICNNASLSYGISQDLSSSATRRRVTAHEIGHNFSAQHDGCSGYSCSGNGPIMCPSIQSGSSSAADDFSSCSLSSINNHINNYGYCL